MVMKLNFNTANRSNLMHSELIICVYVSAEQWSTVPTSTSQVSQIPSIVRGQDNSVHFCQSVMHVQQLHRTMGPMCNAKQSCNCKYTAY